MRKITIGLAAAGAGVAVASLLALGVMWFTAAIPENATQPAAPSSPVSFAPPPATIPWKRDAASINNLHGIYLTPAWTPWTRPPASPRPTLPYLTPPSLRTEPELVQKIAAGLGNPDPQRITAAIRELEQIIEENPLAAEGPFLATWSVQLMAARRSDDVARLSEDLLIHCAYDTAALEQLLSLRIRAFRAAGRNDEALTSARQLYDVASLSGTAEALRHVELCLESNLPHDPSRIAALKLSQGVVPRPPARSGTAVRNAPATAAATVPATMPDFPITEIPPAGNEGRLIEAERQIHGEDLLSLYARGNLLLMARQPRAARSIFIRACEVATENQLPAAVEALARCEKAQSGSIVEANNFVERLH